MLDNSGVLQIPLQNQEMWYQVPLNYFADHFAKKYDKNVHILSKELKDP
ncbi:MAG: hypothetical protein ACFFCI_17550 [Promethearchaeota archaeon]